MVVSWRLLRKMSNDLAGMNGFLGWCRLLATSGQNLDDVFKYLASEDRLGMARDMLRWRHVAPTCPDTLCESMHALGGAVIT